MKMGHELYLTSVARLRAKLKTIGEKFESREQHYKALLRSKDAEIQSLTAKYEEQRRGAENEAARCRALSSQVSTFSHTEAELRSQLNIYVEKFKQVGLLSPLDAFVVSRLFCCCRQLWSFLLIINDKACRLKIRSTTATSSS